MNPPNNDCIECGGTGEIETVLRTNPSEPHLLETETKPCRCTYE